MTLTMARNSNHQVQGVEDATVPQKKEKAH